MAGIEDQHALMVATLAKPGEEIIRDMTPLGAHITHMVIGISGEAGELLDAIKKYAIYQKALDYENVIEELGDIEFYLQGLRFALCISRQQCLEANLKKLAKRYGDQYQYSNQKAQARADKNEPS